MRFARRSIIGGVAVGDERLSRGEFLKRVLGVVGGAAVAALLLAGCGGEEEEEDEGDD
jgi:hypothetical protein